MAEQRSGLEGFYATDLDAVGAALALLDATCGEVKNADLPQLAHDGRFILPRGSLFSQATFGPVRDLVCACGSVSGSEHAGQTCERCGTLCGAASLRNERFGHLLTAPHVHPAAYPALAEAIGMPLLELTALARAEKVLRGGTLVPLLEWEEDALSGPSGVAALLERRQAGHPLLAFTRLERVPVPPAGARPFVEALTLGPTMVHPWIGPLNELWRQLVVQARRELRLIELDAPGIIRANEAGCTQALIDRIWAATREPPPVPGPRVPAPLANDGRLVPPLVEPPRPEHEEGAESEMLGLAFVGDDRLVVQERSRVRVLDLSGDVVFDLRPAGCKLIGALDAGVAVFFEYFGATHPYISEAPGFGSDHVKRDESGAVVWLSPVCGELSALDAVAGRYLERAPDGLPALWAANDQPEDLMLGDLAGGEATPLQIGGDRPGVLALCPGLRFAWVGEGGESQIIDLQTGIPHASPSALEVVEQALDLRSGTLVPLAEDDQDADYYDEVSACAVAFGAGRWWLLWENGVLTDHAGARPVRIVPTPEAAAFDPGATRLAVLVDGELYLIDVESLRVQRVGW